MKIINFDLNRTNAFLIGEMLLLFFVLFIPGIVFGMKGYILVAVPQILLIVYLLWLKKEIPLSEFGLHFPGTKDILYSFLHAFALFFVYLLVIRIVYWLPQGAQDLLLPKEEVAVDDGSGGLVLLLFCLAIGYREELFFRAYLLKRLQQLGLSLKVAILLSSALFGMFHLYSGLLGGLFTFGIALYFSFVFVKTRSLHMVAISHALYNAIMLFIGRLAA